MKRRMNRLLLGLISVIYLVACQSKPATKTIAVSQKGMISHLVFFDLKESIDQEGLSTLEGILDGLRAIPGVLNFTLGNFKDLEDARAFKEFELVLQMDFKRQANYERYQKHPIHLVAKQALEPFLTRPTRSYDYLIH